MLLVEQSIIPKDDRRRFFTSITFRQKGDFSAVSKFLERAKGAVKLSILDEFGRKGVQALSEITPVLTGKTASSWYYEIERKNGVTTISFNNSNIIEGQSIAILIQEGHGTGTGGYVPGYNYIDPALKPYLDELLNKVWKEVTSK